MYRNIWQQCQSSVCAIHFLSKTGTRITTFTGFKIRNFLVTDNVVDKLTKPTEVLLSFTRVDGYNELASKRMSFNDFRKRIIPTALKVNPGYLIINIDFKEFKNIPSLKCSKKIDYLVGHPIAVLGYQLEQDNLTLKSGIISSYYRHPEGLNYIQVDCSINQGNAGSPLIDVESFEVIGVIGHKLASVTRSYKEIMKIFNKNIKILKEVEGHINFEDIDPVQVLIANQNQIKYLATEIYKSSNMRVGFAVELCNLLDYYPESEDIKSVDLEVNMDH